VAGAVAVAVGRTAGLHTVVFADGDTVVVAEGSVAAAADFVVVDVAVAAAGIGAFALLSFVVLVDASSLSLTYSAPVAAVVD